MRNILGVLIAATLTVGCGGGDENVCDLSGAPECTIALKTGDIVQLKMPPPRQIGAGNNYQWTVTPGYDSDVVRLGGERTDEDGDGLDDTIRMQAVGPGSTLILVSEVSDTGAIGSQAEANVTVTGEPIDGAGSTDYLVNIEIAGGYGTSRESGASFEDLALYPTDLVAQGDELYVVSEGRLWHLDTENEIGTIEIDDSAAGTAWPAGGTLISVDPNSDGSMLALINLGASLSVVKIAAGAGSYEELYSATQTELRPGCTTCEGNDVIPFRIRANSDGSSWIATADFNKQIRDGIVYGPQAQGRTATVFDGNDELGPESQVAHGVDTLGRILYWAFNSDGSLNMRTGDQSFGLFVFTGTNNLDRQVRETDFIPHRNSGAPVYEVGTGTYWSYSFYDVQGDAGLFGPYSGRGLFVHRP